MKLLLSLTLLLITCCTYAQRGRKKKQINKTYPISVDCISAKDNQPLHNCQVYINDSLYGLTDSLGLLRFQYTSASANIHVKIVGPNQLYDTEIVKYYLSDFVNPYHFMMYPNERHEQLIRTKEDSIYGFVDPINQFLDNNCNDTSFSKSTNEIATFPGGPDAMTQYIYNNAIFSEKATAQGISGRAIISFVIQKNGKISHIIPHKKTHPLIYREAIRLVRNMPEWSPATSNGKNIRTHACVPIKFLLD